MGTWNVRIITAKEHELDNEFNQASFYILRVTET